MKKTIPAVAVTLAGACLLTACASTTIQSQAQGEIPVIILPATHVQVVQTTARQDGPKIIVGGQVQRKQTHGRVIPKGHVDIMIVDRQGKTLQQIPAQCTPEIIPRIDGMKSTFMAEIPVIVPKGGFVGVKFHSGSHNI